MRFALACCALLAIAASPRGGCGSPSFDPCAAKPCGASCVECAPGDRSCVETAVVKACDPSGACLAADSFTCAPAPADPCAGRKCGEACTVEPTCRSATPPCMMPSVLGHCDATGLCVAADVACVTPPPPTPDPCVGKACGASCNPCGDADPCPTFAATACDRFGQCVFASPALCYDPCAGKPCHATCDPCPPGAAGCMALLCTTWCDGGGQCVCSGGGAACR